MCEVIGKREDFYGVYGPNWKRNNRYKMKITGAKTMKVRVKWDERASFGPVSEVISISKEVEAGFLDMIKDYIHDRYAPHNSDSIKTIEIVETEAE